MKHSLIAATLLAAATSAGAQPCTFNHVSTLEGDYRDVAVLGTYAYVPQGEEGMLIVDISDPDAPAYAGHLDLGCSYIEIVGQTAYVTRGADGLSILDLTNPTAPTVLGTYNAVNSARVFDVQGSLVYVFDYPSAIHIIDISNPAAPTLVHTMPATNTVVDVEVHGPILYVVLRTTGLVTYDVSDPNAPVELDTFVTADTSSDNAYAVKVVGTRAYVAEEQPNLLVIDVSDPSSMSLLGAADIPPGNGRDIEIVGSTAYVGESSSFSTFDLTDPDHPAHLDDLHDVSGGGGRIAIAGSFVYQADRYDGSSGGLMIHDVANPANIVTRSKITTPVYIWDVNIRDDIAYLLDNNGFIILDVSVPGVPAFISCTPSEAVGAVLRDQYYYAAGGYDDTDLVIYDVSDPAAPVAVGSYNGFYTSYDPTLAGDAIYLVDNEGDSYVHVLNVADPANPTYVTNLPQTLAIDIEVVGDTLFVTGIPGLSAYDISNPFAPVLIDTQNLPDPSYTLGISGDTAYVVTSGSPPSIVSIDISDPAHLTPLDSVSIADTAGYVFLFEGNTAYFRSYDGLYALDISNPSNLSASLVDPAVDLAVFARDGSRLFTQPGLTEWEIDCTPACPADLDGNGVYNLDDINLFANAFVTADLLADIDGNGVLNLDDVNLFAASFVAGC
ncbi:MAG: GC-type dockerin domain-anchored protein [Phycisphaerales bacterium]